MAERIDSIGFGDLKLIQNTEAFCYGIDAVLLADFAKVKPGRRVCDLGTGTGVIPLILSHKTEASELIGVEVQEESFLRAQRNVELNHLQGRVRMICCNVKDISSSLDRGCCDVVVSNPPYMGTVNGLKNDATEKTIARHETTADLRDFMEAASFVLKEKGDFYMVHRPNRLVDICQIGRELRMEPKHMQFVSPKRDAKPNILLVHFVKYGNAELKMMEPLSVYDDNGDYTEAILHIYERI